MPILDPSRLKRLAKEGSWIIVGQFAAVAGTLVLVRILTEYLTPTEYGQLALGMTVAGLLNQVIFGGISNGIGRYYAIAAEADDLNGYLFSARTLMVYGTLAAIVVGGLILISIQQSGYSQWTGLAAATLVFAVFSGFNSTLGGIQNAARQRAVVAFHGGLDAWLKILLAVTVMAWLGTTSEAVVVGYSASTLIVTLSQLVFLRRTIPYRTAPIPSGYEWLQRMWSYSWPFSTFGLFTWMQLASDRWALERYATTVDVGHYAVLLQLGYAPIVIVSGMATAFLAPILFQRSGDATNAIRNAGVHRLSWKLTYLALVLTGAATLLTFTVHEWLFSLLVASEYRSLSTLLPWFVLAGGLFAAGQALSLKLSSEMKTHVLAKVKILTAVFGVGLNILGALLAGLAGVVFALVMFSASYLLWMVILARRQWMIPMKHAAAAT